MRDESAVQREALTGVVNEMLAMADEIEAQAEAWAAALEKLGEQRAAQLRRKAYELHMRRGAMKPTPCAAQANSHVEEPTPADTARAA
jgi:hypothetical protein